MNLHTSAQHILAKMDAHRPTGARPMVFLDSGTFPQLLQYMQFMKAGDWYTFDAFGIQAMGGMGLWGAMQLSTPDSQSPVGIQPQRLEYIAKVMKGKSASDLLREQHRLMDQALADGRPIYAVLTSLQEADFRQRFIKGTYRMIELDHWKEPCNVRFPEDDPFDGRPAFTREQSPLEPAVQSGRPFISWAPEFLKMFEIKKP
jgi:hypothetical protein